jgi:uncharacterized membrane protein YeaQ/YmgE (transglycosylase-associated protein family)
MSIIIWILVGLAAGYIATKLLGGSGGLLYNLAIGLFGAVVGGWLLRALNVAIPAGTAGDLLSAIVGAIVFLGIWRLIRR